MREAVGPDAAVLLDSGVRTGSDVVKAIALGADAVAARPAVHLRPGPRRAATACADVLANIVAELDLTMGLSGVGAVAQIGPDLLQTAALSVQAPPD